MVSPFCPFIRAAKSLLGHRTLSISLFLSVLPLTTWGQEDGERGVNSFFLSLEMAKRTEEERDTRIEKGKAEKARGITQGKRETQF